MGWAYLRPFWLLLPVLALNVTVRWAGGGDAHPLSLRHLTHKATAVSLLVRHRLGDLAGEGHQDLSRVVRAAAREAHVPARFALQVARAESSLQPHAISRTGAMGLMQLMPDTAEAFGATDPFDPMDNARAGTRYLRWLWTRYGGDKRRVLAAYNAGPGRVPRSGEYNIPSETQRYVARILN